jgi:cytochrome c
MKLVFVAAAAALATFAAGQALADEALAKAKNCLACHSVAQKMIGPAYKDVAAKYAGQGKEAELADKIIKGGKGAWGEIPMPPNNVTADEAKKLAEWVLSLK